MRALVKRYPVNARYEYESEVWEEPRWTPLMKGDDLLPYTDENYGYALCEDVPDGVELMPEDFTVTEHSKTVPAEYPEDEPRTVKYWTAVYTPQPRDAQDGSEGPL